MTIYISYTGYCAECAVVTRIYIVIGFASGNGHYRRLARDSIRITVSSLCPTLVGRTGRITSRSNKLDDIISREQITKAIEAVRIGSCRTDLSTRSIQQVYRDIRNTCFAIILNTILVCIVPYEITQGTAVNHAYINACGRSTTTCCVDRHFIGFTSCNSHRWVGSVRAAQSCCWRPDIAGNGITGLSWRGGTGR